MQGIVQAEGTYNELLRSHLAALSSMEDAESAGDFDSMEEKPKEIEIKPKDDKLMSEDLKAKQEVEFSTNYLNRFLIILSFFVVLS